MGANNQDRINDIIDLTATGKQSAQLLKQLDEVIEKFDKVKNLKITLEGSKTFGEVAKVTTQLSGGMTDLKKASNNLQKALSENNVELQGFKLQTQEANKAAKEQAQEQLGLTNEYERQTKRLAEVKRELKNLSVQGKESTAEFKELKNEFVALDTVIRKAEQGAGEFQRSVGNYGNAFKGALKTLEDELTNVKNKLNDPALSGKQLDSLINQEKLLSEVLEGVSVNFSSTRAEARAFQEAATKIGLTLGQESEAFQQFRQEVGAGVDDIADIKQSIKLAASDTQGFDKLIGAAQGLTGAFSVAQGAAALFGQDSEDLQKTFVKLQAAMTILNGLQAVQNELKNKDSIFRKVAIYLTGTETKLVQANTVAQGANAVATETATVATKSFGTALKGIGIGILLTLIPFLVSAMNTLDKVVNSTAKNQKALNDINQKAIENYATEKANLDILVAQLRNENLSRKAKEDLIKEAQDKYPGYFSNLKIEHDQVIGLADAYDRASKGIFAKAKAEAASSIVAENTKQALEDQQALQERINEFADYEQKNPGGVGPGSAKAQIKELESRKQVISDKLDKDNKFLIDQIIANNIEIEKAGGKVTDSKDTKSSATSGNDNLAKQLEAAFQLRQLYAERIANTFKETGDNENLDYKQRIVNLHLFSNAQKKIIDDRVQFEIQQNKLTGDQASVVRVKGDNDKVAVTKSVEAAVTKIIDDETKKRLKLEEDQKSADAAKDQQQLDEYQAYVDNENAIAQTAREKDYENLKKKKEAEDELEKKSAELKKQLYQEVFDFVQNIVVAGYEKQKNAVQAQIDIVEKQKNAEIEAANASTLSVAQKADRIAVINATAQTKKDNLERQQKEIEVKKAKAEKAFSILRIAISTIQKVAEIKATAALLLSNPVTAPFAAFSLAQIPFVIASGALSAAAILATPIPKYKQGTKSHPGGLAEVGHGQREVVVTPTGDVSFTPTTETLMSLPKGTKVFPTVLDYVNEYSKNAININTPIVHDTGDKNFDRVYIQSMELKLDALSNELSGIKSAIANKPVANITNTHWGIVNQQVSHAGWTEYMNKYFRT